MEWRKLSLLGKLISVWVRTTVTSGTNSLSTWSIFACAISRLVGAAAPTGSAYTTASSSGLLLRSRTATSRSAAQATYGARPRMMHTAAALITSALHDIALDRRQEVQELVALPQPDPTPPHGVPQYVDE